MKNINILKDNGIDVESSLEILGDMEMYDETLNDFLSEVEQRLKDLENYKNSNDMENYAILAHSMKSDSKYLGFKKLAEISLNHELKAKEKEINYITDNFEDLKEETNRIINTIKNYLN